MLVQKHLTRAPGLVVVKMSWLILAISRLFNLTRQRKALFTRLEFLLVPLFIAKKRLPCQVLVEKQREASKIVLGVEPAGSDSESPIKVDHERGCGAFRPRSGFH